MNHKEFTLDFIPPELDFAFPILMDYFKDPKLVRYLSRKDFYDTYVLTFYKAKEKFDPSKNVKFSTYVYKAIINQAIRNLKSQKETPFSQLTEDDKENVLNVTIETNTSRLDSRMDMTDLLKKANLKQKEINLLHMRYKMGLSDTEIGKKSNVTRQCINEKLKNILEKIKRASNDNTKSGI